MAVNYADGMLFGSIPAYPIAAIAGAYCAGSRWSLPLVAPAGLVVGVAVVLASRFRIYSLLERLLRSRLMRNDRSFIAATLGCPLMVVYLAFPHAVNIAGVCGTFKGAFWVADALSHL
jgi:hypothetical protein